MALSRRIRRRDAPGPQRDGRIYTVIDKTTGAATDIDLDYDTSPQPTDTALYVTAAQKN